jgi:hypothetical protein
MLEAGFFPACKLLSQEFCTAYTELNTRHLYHRYMVCARGDAETIDGFLHPGCHGELRIVALWSIALTIHTGWRFLLCHCRRYRAARWSARPKRVAMDIHHIWSDHYFGWYHRLLLFVLSSPFGFSRHPFVVIQGFPDKNTFLTKEETKWVLDRIEADRADSQYDHFTAEKLWGYARDIHNWGFALLFGCTTTAGYAFAYFLPIILMEGMGYSSRDAQLLAAPPSVFAAVFAFALAILVDRKRSFAPFIVFPACVTIVGLCMVCLFVHYSYTNLLILFLQTAFHTSNSVRYAGVFLGGAGASANTPAVLGYLHNNVAGQSKRAFTTAIAIGGGGIGGIIASTAFRAQDAPGYRPGRK